MRTLRVLAILSVAFLVGASSAEVVVRAQREREAGRTTPLGSLVSLELRSEGATIARSRVVSPSGKLAKMEFRDPADPATVRMVLRVSTEPEASGAVCVDYSLEIPDLDVTTSGRFSVKPGKEETLALGHDLTAVWTAMPVPSRAFDDWVKAERARRAPRAS